MLIDPILSSLAPLDIARFLVGQREAIVEITQTPAAIAIGAMFVLSAGFAREYDGEDLRAEPQHLLIPFGASIVTSLLLFTGIYFSLRAHYGVVTGFWSLYARFLAVYWMTAPLAWLYALPVERWFSAAGAVKANLWLLAIVSTWRVILMIRIVMVLYGAPIEGAFSLVVAFAVTVTAVTAWMLPLPMPIVVVMGGIRMSEKDELILNVMSWIRGLSIVGAPLFWFITWMCIDSPSRHWRESTIEAIGGGIHLSLWAVAAGSIGIWFWLARGPQREQSLRLLVESSFRSGDIDRALEIMSSHKQADFPPHWDPPPRPNYRLLKPRTVDVVDTIVRHGAASWVTDAYHHKLGREYANLSAIIFNFVMFRVSSKSGDMTWDEAERLMPILEQSAAARDAAKKFGEWYTLDQQDFDEAPETSDDAERKSALYRRLLAVLEQNRESST